MRSGQFLLHPLLEVNDPQITKEVTVMGRPKLASLKHVQSIFNASHVGKQMTYFRYNRYSEATLHKQEVNTFISNVCKDHHWYHNMLGRTLLSEHRPS